jgi:DNA polymerase elongation subunit (family B)
LTQGFLLDAHTDGAGNMITWVRDQNGAHPHRSPHRPAFYVHAPPQDLRRIARRITRLDPRLDTRLESHRLGLERRRREVLRVEVPHPLRLHDIATRVDGWGAHHRFDLYDVDLRDSHRHMLTSRVFPFARVHTQHPRIHVDQVGLPEPHPQRATFTTHDDQWDPHPYIPPLRTLHLRARLDNPPGAPATPRHRVKAVTLDDETITGTESEVLEQLTNRIQELDPDILFTRHGDRFLLSHLRERARRQNVPLRLGRARDPTRPTRAAKSYWSYGQIKWQPAVELLRGRLHIDETASFFHRESGLTGLIDLARISSIPLQEMARLGPGTVVTAIQIDRAKREDRLVPWKKNRAEDFKSERRLVEADRGGYIHDPHVGLHEGVVELDFSSMYPSIMTSRNVSPETILCNCCTPTTPGTLIVPQIGYVTCRKNGFVGRAIAPLLERRDAMKKRIKSDPDNRARWQGASDALKWLLVTSFGYQGYRNARFGRIECHEAICAWGRELLLTAGEVAEEQGFHVLHGIVDSLWLAPRQHTGPQELTRRAHHLGQAVSKALGVRLDVEGAYDWIVFLPNRSHTAQGVDMVGALNRFYGKFHEPPQKITRSQAGQKPDHLAGGQLKVRGVELRQRSAPGIVRQAQEAFLMALHPAMDADGFHKRIPSALQAAGQSIQRLHTGKVPLTELVIQKSVGKELEAYRVETETKAALRLLADQGVQVAPGDIVRYIIKDATARDPHERVAEERLLTGDEDYDPGYYETLVLRSLESLLLPFGWCLENLRAHYEPRTQARLEDYGLVSGSTQT